jgi:Ni,Fe-hydrogenase III large subunit/Ni,Fe-hydrogenase III component G
MKVIEQPQKLASVPEALNLLGGRNHRLVSIFGSVAGNGGLHVHYLVDVDNREYRMLEVPVNGPVPSATRITAAAAWYERELHDQYGVPIEGHPNLQPLLFHENWPAGIHPMAADEASAGGVRSEYRFLQVKGTGVCEVPVGPVHAGIIEPGHFRFSVVGDTVLHLELRHFFTHKGTEKLFQGTPVLSGPMIAESVSGDNCFSHAVAFCQAVEQACGIDVPPRAQAIRLIGLELERMLAHIADVGALCGDVAFIVPAAYNARIKELLLQASARCLGTRFWKGVAIPGGITRDLDAQQAVELSRSVAGAAREFCEMAHIILDTPSVQDRFEGTGILKREAARDLAVVGPVARSSGVILDVRRDHPYGRYRELSVEVPHYRYGDVLARARIRIDETAIAARLIADTFNALPSGPIRSALSCDGDGEGLSAVESPRGELLYWVRLHQGRIARCHIKSPSFQNWPALPLAMPGNIIADFPLINKSFNLSYSGCDR